MQRYVRITGQRAAGISWLRTSMARNLQQSTAVYCSTTIASRGYVLLFVCSCLLAMLERCMPWGRWLRSAPKNGSCTSDTIWYTEQKQQYQGKDCYVPGTGQQWTRPYMHEEDNVWYDIIPTEHIRTRFMPGVYEEYQGRIDAATRNRELVCTRFILRGSRTDSRFSLDDLDLLRRIYLYIV